MVGCLKKEYTQRPKCPMVMERRGFPLRPEREGVPLRNVLLQEFAYGAAARGIPRDAALLARAVGMPESGAERDTACHRSKFQTL